MKLKRILAIGITLGIVLTLSIQVFAAPAIEKIQASVNNQFTFDFDGIEKELPSEYKVIVYNDRSYVPVRFVAENLGAKVDWNDETKRISLISKEGNCDDPKEDNTGVYNYKQLPQTRDSRGYRVSVLSYLKESQGMGDRLYISISNDHDTAVRLDQMATKIIAGDKVYTIDIADAIDFDTKWYNDIHKDEYIEGYLRLPKDLKNKDKLHLELTLNSSNNQGSSSDILEFDIKL